MLLLLVSQLVAELFAVVMETDTRGSGPRVKRVEWLRRELPSQLPPNEVFFFYLVCLSEKGGRKNMKRQRQHVEANSVRRKCGNALQAVAPCSRYEVSTPQSLSSTPLARAVRRRCKKDASRVGYRTWQPRHEADMANEAGRKVASDWC